MPRGITVAELAALLDAPLPPPILDARGRSLYAVGTIPGAINVGLNPAGYLPDARTRRVVVILPPEADAALAAAWATRLGPDTETLVLGGGFAEWLAHGGAVERPGDAYTRPGTVPFTIPRGLCEMNTPALEYR